MACDLWKFVKDIISTWECVQANRMCQTERYGVFKKNFAKENYNKKVNIKIQNKYKQHKENKIKKKSVGNAQNMIGKYFA